MTPRHAKLHLDIVEPSKVIAQHSTMFKGWIDASVLSNEAAMGSTQDIIVFGHSSKRSEISAAAIDKVVFCSIPVINGNSRKLVLKTLVEFCVIGWRLLRLRKNRVLVIMCLMPSTMILFELLMRCFPRKHVAVCLHGELEGALDPHRQGPKSYGFYVLKWLKVRKFESTLNLMVLDRCIAKQLTKHWPDKINLDALHVVEHPIIPWPNNRDSQSAVISACFVGYQTPNKGYDDFEFISTQTENLDFLAIGGGQVYNLKTQSKVDLTGFDNYLDSLAGCDFAIFPYTNGYELTLSAAVLDAIAAGCHVIATRLPFFESLSEQLGGSCITIVDNKFDIIALLNDENWLSVKTSQRLEIFKNVNNSVYSLGHIGNSMRSMIEKMDHRRNTKP